MLTDTRVAPPSQRRLTALAGHRVFAALLLPAAALRVVTMLGYRPVTLYWYDSFTYLDTAVHPAPSATFHPIGYPLLLLVVFVLAVRRVGWRPLAALVLAGSLPLAGYAAWYARHHGRFALSGADGVALWARTMTFADCTRIRPSPGLARLCPNGTKVDAASEYVWAPEASLNLLPGDRFAHNDLARSFAIDAILAQPLDYLGDVVGDTAIAFSWTPIPHPDRTIPAM